MVAPYKKTPQMFMGAPAAPQATQPAGMFAAPLQRPKQNFDWASLLQGLGVGLLTGNNVGEGIGQGLLYARQFGDQRADNERYDRREQREESRYQTGVAKEAAATQQAADQMAQFNATIDTMQIPEDQKAFLRAMGPGSANYKDLFPSADGDAPTIKDFFEGGKVIQKQWNGADWVPVGEGPRWAPPTQGDGGPKTSLVPFYTTDENGKVHMFQPTASGVPVEVQLPPGMSPTKPLQYLDLGTSQLPVQPLGGAPGVPIPKDVAGEASAKITGKGEGEAIEAYRSMSSKMPGLETVITKLDDLSEKATYTKSGQALDTVIRETGMEPRESAIARTEYISIVDNQVLPLLRDTFGAAFTEREGASLRATLGNPDLSPKEKQATLRAFIEQKRRDIEALAARAAIGSAPQSNPAPSSGGGEDPLGIR